MNILAWECLKYFLTIFVAFLIPVYWQRYGVQNFLWLSDIGLFLTVIALWFHSPLIMSIAAVGIIALELLWCVDFFLKLLFNYKITSLADYMFDASYSLPLRALSLFHVIVPVIWILYLKQFGYDQRACIYFIFLYWIIIGATFMFTDKKENINWVFLIKKYKKCTILPYQFVIILAVCVPVFIVLPTHYICIYLFNS